MGDLETPSVEAGIREPVMKDLWPDARPDLNQLIWVTWPAVSWLMPLIVYLLMAKTGGWEILILMPFMLVIIPGAALLGLIPRRILRRGGAKTTPTLISILLFVNWGSQILFGLSHRGLGDSGGLDSQLGEAFGMSDARQGNLSGAAILIALTSFCGVLVMASLMTDSARMRTVPSWVGWAAVPAVPLLLVGLVVGMSVASTADEEAAFVAESEEWEAAQRSLVGLRQEIAENGWKISCCGVDDNDPRSYENGASSLASMNVWMSVIVETTPEETFDSILDVVAAQGWEIEDTSYRVPEPAESVDPTPTPMPTPVTPTELSPYEVWSATVTAVDDSDELLTITVSASVVPDDPSSVVELSLHTAPRSAWDVVEVRWWERVDASGQTFPDLDSVRFRYDEWPRLLHVNSY